MRMRRNHQLTKTNPERVSDELTRFLLEDIRWLLK